MLLCKICKKDLQLPDELFPHMASNHLSAPEFFCPFKDCIRFYPFEKSLRNHLYKEQFPVESNEKQIINIIPAYQEEPIHSGESDRTANFTSQIIVDQLKLDLLHHALELLADENIARKKSLEILQKSFTLYSKAFKYLLKSNINNSILNRFNDFFSDSSSIQTEHSTDYGKH